jgi:cobalt-zinc-cadmium efflux system protein
MRKEHPFAMAHDHQHGPATYNRAFAIGVALNLGFVAVEAIFGVLAHSLALVADAGHNLSDVLGLLLAWGAAVLAQRWPTHRRTYGWRRSTILAAVANAVVLLVALAIIIIEAIRRFGHPEPVAEKTVIVVALVGIAVNGATAWLFASGRKSDLNIRGAFMHMAADAAVSAGVVIAALVILATGWLWLDPAVSLVIAAVILFGTWGLLRDSLNLALDAVPDEIDPAAVRAYLLALPGIVGVHDLHIWGMSTTETALTAHLVTAQVQRPADTDALLAKVKRDLHDRFGIEHTTLQIEHDDLCVGCPLEPAGARV